jgi:hypothetical protein
MPDSPTKVNRAVGPEGGSRPDTGGADREPTSDEDAQRALDGGDREKIDRTLDELDVSTTESGKDQTAKTDTEGSNSSSKNLDEQGD